MRLPGQDTTEALPRCQRKAIASFLLELGTGFTFVVQQKHSFSPKTQST